MSSKVGKSSKSIESSEEKRKKYWERYWENHREDILSKRRDKYASNEEYQSRLRHMRRENYQKNRVVRTKVPDTEFVESSFMPHLINVHGKEVLMYDVAYFALVIGRSIHTIRHWERSEIIPKTDFRIGRRCAYSREMIDVVYDGLKDQGFPCNVNMSELREYVGKRWIK